RHFTIKLVRSRVLCDQTVVTTRANMNRGFITEDVKDGTQRDTVTCSAPVNRIPSRPVCQAAQTTIPL
ncbi:hypothetical protein HDU87_007042, partial [Geranomyces variabilis]